MKMGPSLSHGSNMMLINSILNISSGPVDMSCARCKIFSLQKLILLTMYMPNKSKG